MPDIMVDLGNADAKVGQALSLAKLSQGAALQLLKRPGGRSQGRGGAYLFWDRGKHCWVNAEFGDCLDKHFKRLRDLPPISPIGKTGKSERQCHQQYVENPMKVCNHVGLSKDALPNKANLTHAINVKI